MHQIAQRYANGGRDFRWADLVGANLAGATLFGANLRWANLAGANLTGADLTGADLREAYLFGADLFGADLTGADLSGADLRGANLYRADLFGADLSGANLCRADLRGANLRWANLAGATLFGANLHWANLAGAGLSGADLSDTCLDPNAPVPAITDAEITAAGLETRDDRIYGYRTLRSLYCGDTEYTPGEHVASVFSVDRHTECHPGIYFASREWLVEKHPQESLVRCYALRTETVHAGGKWRAKRIWVTEE